MRTLKTALIILLSGWWVISLIFVNVDKIKFDFPGFSFLVFAFVVASFTYMLINLHALWKAVGVPQSVKNKNPNIDRVDKSKNKKSFMKFLWVAFILDILGILISGRLLWTDLGLAMIIFGVPLLIAAITSSAVYFFSTIKH